MKEKAKAVLFAVLVMTLIVGIELAANRVVHGRLVFDPQQSGMSGYEGGGAGGGGDHIRFDQSMPSWWRELYDWLYGKPYMGPLGGGGGGGF